MQHHQLAILQEKLIGFRKDRARLQNSNRANEIVRVDDQIRNMKHRIDNLGGTGILKMVIVVIKFEMLMRVSFDNSRIVEPKTQTFTYFFHDLDDESIYMLLESWRRNGETYLSKSIIKVPLRQPLPSSLENNMISWQISSDI